MAALTSLRDLYVDAFAAGNIDIVSRLPKLQLLELSNGRSMTNDSLTALSNLSTLRTLRLECNKQVTDLAPLSRLSELSELSLWDSSVADLSPLARLPLAELVLDHNLRVTDLSPLAGMASLCVASFEHCEILPDAAIHTLVSLKQLHTLNLSYCSFLTSTGLCGLAGLTSLKKLDVSFTALSDHALGVLCQALELEELVLSCCDITNAGLTFVALQRTLHTLHLDHCERVSDLAPLAELTTLRELLLSDCDGLVDDSLYSLCGLVDLQKLDLSNTYLTEACLAALPCLTSLQMLDVDFSFTDRALQTISSLASLRHVKVHKQISNFGLKSLSGLAGLQHLDLSHCRRVRDQGLAGLTSLLVLHTLNLSGVPLTDVGMAHVAQIAGLVCLNLTGCDLITVRGVWKLADLDSLETLTLDHCVKVSLVNRGLPQFAKLRTLELAEVGIDVLYPSILTPALETLDASACPGLVIKNLRWCRADPRLKTLRLPQCASVGPSSLQELAHLPRLRELDLSDNVQITDDCVQILARLPLATLNLSNCSSITDQALCMLSASPTLTCLNVSGCDLITDQGLQSLSRSGLKHLDFSSCDRVTTAGTVGFSDWVQLRAEYCAGWGLAALANTLIAPDPRMPQNLHANDLLRVSMLAFASKLQSKHWFFVDATLGAAQGCVTLHVDRLATGDGTMLVRASFADIDWTFMAYQFSNAIPAVHHRWYFFKEQGHPRVKVHARPLS
jgi:Leucine-rich repeat (LRR) protein